MKPVGFTLLIALFAATPSSAQEPKNLDAQYRDVAARLIGAALVDEGGWDKLSYLTTRIGNRLSGTASLEHAVQWVFERMKAEGLENPRLQPVKVPHWVRGREAARVVELHRTGVAVPLGNVAGEPRPDRTLKGKLIRGVGQIHRPAR